ncbi:hypothetical protein ACYUJ6_01040 [Clostridium sp. JNZ X4-2]
MQKAKVSDRINGNEYCVLLCLYFGLLKKEQLYTDKFLHLKIYVSDAVFA